MFRWICAIVSNSKITTNVRIEPGSTVVGSLWENRNRRTIVPDHYSDPLNFSHLLGLTDIEISKFFMLERYKNNIFVGDINYGNLYFFELNGTRNGLKFDPVTQSGLDDLTADGEDELNELVLGSGFAGITDIETGPDGFLYILTFNQESDGDGKIYRISSNDPTGVD